MRIISKFTDYYDHCVAQYGYDDSRVFDRRNKNGDKLSLYENHFLICIAGKRYPVVKHKGKWYFDESQDLDLQDNYFIGSHKNKKTDLNQKYRQPVLIERTNWINRRGERYAYIPTLSEFGFPAIIPAEEMYMTIYNYLGWLKDNPAPLNNQTDKEKVIAHGFDDKRSFRPKIKS